MALIGSVEMLNLCDEVDFAICHETGGVQVIDFNPDFETGVSVVGRPERIFLMQSFAFDQSAGNDQLGLFCAKDDVWLAVSGSVARNNRTRRRYRCGPLGAAPCATGDAPDQRCGRGFFADRRCRRR